jgi:hypothetical protein
MWVGASSAYWLAASCPSGKTVVSGGYEVAGTTPYVTVSSSQPYGDSAASGWRVAFRNATTTALTNVQVKAYAVCATVN